MANSLRTLFVCMHCCVLQGCGFNPYSFVITYTSGMQLLLML